MAMGAPPVKMQPAEKPREIRLQQVPIAAIFNVEFQALQTPPEHQETIRKVYELYVSGLMNSVSVWLGFGDASRADRQKLAEAVNKVDERELFAFLSDVFHRDFRASFKDNNLLTISMQDNRFNCYSSTVLLADALTRLGKPINIIIPPTHVLLCGEGFALETTSENPETTVYQKALLGSYYPLWQETDSGKLLGLAHVWAGLKFDEMGSPYDALTAYSKALEISPKLAEPWYNTGNTLFKLGRLYEAVAAFDNAIGLNPKNVAAWHSKGTALKHMGRRGEAKKCLKMAKELESRQ